MIDHLTRHLFSTRQFPNYHTYSIPPFVLGFVWLGLLYAVYLLHPAGEPGDQALISSVMVAVGLLLLSALAHWLFPGMEAWLTVLSLSMLVLFLAFSWPHPAILHLLVLPILLAEMLLSLYSSILVMLVQIIVMYLIGALDPQFYPAALDFTLPIVSQALTSFLVTGEGWFIQNIFSQAESDFRRYQNLLVELRNNQLAAQQNLANIEYSNRQLSLLYEKNISLRREAEEAIENKTNFIARVSHEIRTPLSVILGITEGLIRDEDVYREEIPAFLLDDIHLVRRNSEHLLSLVNDVLDLTRVEANQLVLHKQWSSLSDLVTSAMEIVRPLAERKNLFLTFHENGPYPEVYCDGTRIRQVVLNLLTNAIRYTSTGGITISLDQPAEHEQVLAVKDTGRGIAPDQTEKVFEPFFRSDKESMGSGLGLSVCRQFMQLHGGRIWLESQPGRGSTFFISLPLIANESARPNPQQYLSEDWEVAESFRLQSGRFSYFSKPHIVIQSGLHYLPEVIEQAFPKYFFSHVTHADELIELVTHAPAQLIVVNGREPAALIQTIQAISADVRDTPIIGTLLPILEEESPHADISAFLRKPFSGEQLTRALENLRPRPRLILIIDDNTDIHQVVMRMLAEDGQFHSAQLITAADGQCGLRLARERTPDAILLDLLLPDLTGQQLIRMLRDDPLTASIPVIVISAYELEEDSASTNLLIYRQTQPVTLSQVFEGAFQPSKTTDQV